MSVGVAVATVAGCLEVRLAVEVGLNMDVIGRSSCHLSCGRVETWAAVGDRGPGPRRGGVNPWGPPPS